MYFVVFFLVKYVTHFVVSFQVVVEYIDADGEVSSVVGVGPVPALRSKLPPLHHHSMEVDQGEQNALELILTRAHLKCILQPTCRHTDEPVAYTRTLHAVLSETELQPNLLQH